jgi:hypothetical protein
MAEQRAEGRGQQAGGARWGAAGASARVIPPSAFRLPPSRSALSLIEVLVAMGILTLGLLGVAALFPVGGVYMQSGDVTDQAGSIAQAALDDAIVRGYLNPENWVVHDITRNGGAVGTFANLVTGSSLTGAGIEMIPRVSGLRADLATVATLAAPVNYKGSNKVSGASLRSAKFGDAFVIDPLGLAAGLATNPSNAIVTNINDSSAVRHFPALQAPFPLPAAWDTWAAAGCHWPVRRVTPVHQTWVLNLVNPTSATVPLLGYSQPGYGLQEPAGEAMFRGVGDVANTLPEDQSVPGRTRWQTWTSNALANEPISSARQTRGDYSWIISVSPGSSEARDALATRPDAYQYDVSAVVFYKRPLIRGRAGAIEAERLVNARVISTGASGGELLLDRRPSSEDPVTESPFKGLKSGEYVMLCGPHPNSTALRPQFFLQWYRVTLIEDAGAPPLAGVSAPNDRRLNREGTSARVIVSLRGPDWPWPAAPNIGDTSLLSNNLRVAILPGAVAVHTKTMRLESGSAWNP